MSTKTAALAIVVLLAGCETPKQYVATSRPLCSAIKSVLISKDDQMTDGTASQIEANNLGRAKVCTK